MKASLLRIKNSIADRLQALSRQKAPKNLEDTSKNIILYGRRNDFPIKLAETVEKSPTGLANIDVIQTFIKGEGFNSKDIEDFKINRDQTFLELHSEVADQFGMFDGFSINTKYSIENFKLKSAKILQFQGSRFQIQDPTGEINNIYWNPWYGTREYKAEHTLIFPVFDPDPKVVEDQIITFGKRAEKKDSQHQQFMGQCLYFGKTTPTSPFYPKPSWWSAKSWLRADWKIGLFHENNIDNNFLLGFIVKMIGDPNAPSTHPDDIEKDSDDQPTGKILKTVGERFDLDMQSSLSGAVNGGAALVIWQKMIGDNGSAPAIEAFPSNAMDTLFITLSDLITKHIARATKVPPILANIEQSGSLSDASKIRESTELMNKRTESQRLILEKKYKEILRAHEAPPEGVEDLKIKPFNFFKQAVPNDKIWEQMSTEDRRSWIKENTNIEINEQDTVNQP